MRFVPALLLLVVVACAQDSGGPDPIVPQLAITAGDIQTDTVMKTLPIQIAALLTNKTTGDPLPGRVVNWVVIEGGGQVFAGVTQTGGDGVARQSWTLGQLAGGQRLVARWLDPETGEPVTLDTARATAIPASAIGSFARAQADTVSFGDTLLVEHGYTDAWGNPTWAGCAAPDSVGWTWDTDGVIYEGTGGFIYTTNPNTTWYVLSPVTIGERRFVRFVMPSHTADVHFQAHNACFGSTTAAGTVYLRP